MWSTGTLRAAACGNSLLAKTVSCRDGDLNTGNGIHHCAAWAARGIVGTGALPAMGL
jgi:hypothetical protein